VLYFDNLSRDTADSYLADGLTDELIVRLQQVPRLEVRSRFESQRFRGRTNPSPAALGRALNASYLVTGGVQRSGARVRLRVELVRAATGAAVWSGAPESSTGDILALESEIASSVATAIAGRLLPAERAVLARRPTENRAAHDLYLRGMEALESWSEQGPQAALGFFDRALALDSGFAQAWAAQAIGWIMLADAFVDPREAYPKARAAAARALAIDSGLAIAWAAYAGAILSIELDLPAASRYANRAKALDPRLNWAYLVQMTPLIGTGRTEDARAAGRLSYTSDTLDAVGAGSYLWTLFWTGAPDSMAALLRRLGGALTPEDRQSYDGLVRYAAGDYAAAARELNWRYYGGWLSGEYLRALVRLGQESAARLALDSMVAAARTGWYNAYPIARGYAILGENEEALRWLARAFDQRTPWVFLTPVDPELAPLRADPRFAALVSRIRF
jgi:TolB-like protein